MRLLPLDQVQRVLCLGAHADDIEIGCGGTLLKLAGRNPRLEVTWVVLSADAARATEARCSAQRLLPGVAEGSLRIETFPDCCFPAAWSELKQYFADLARELVGDRSPDLVFTHRLDDRHQDHRLTAELTWNAFRDHLILEYEIPKFEGDLGQPNRFVALDEQHFEAKLKILAECFPSQTIALVP